MTERPERGLGGAEPQGSDLEGEVVEPPPTPNPPASTGPSASAAPTPAPGPVTGQARVAAVLLLLFGTWFAVLGLLTIVAALDPSGFMGRDVGAGFGEVSRGTVAFIGVGVLLVALIEVAAAVGAWRGAAWGRVLGVVYAIVFGLGAVLVLVGSHDASTESVAIVVGVVVAYSIVAVALVAGWRHAAR